MLKFNLEKSLANAKLNQIWMYSQFQLKSLISLLGRCLDLDDRQELGSVSGVGNCCKVS